jgi:hypothetical protein
MAIQVHTIHEDVQIKFVEDVEKELGRLFLKLTSPDHHSAASVHQEQLVRLRPHISRLRSNRSCLTCLLRMPEKVLSCGHSICEICLQLFGSNGQSGDHTFHLEDCPVCGKFTNRSFRLVPPNAGTRLLSIDGGGVRGVISIIFLRHLHQQLEEFDCPLGEFFDLVCGTSAGKSLQANALEPTDCSCMFKVD